MIPLFRAERRSSLFAPAEGLSGNGDLRILVVGFGNVRSECSRTLRPKMTNGVGFSVNVECL